MKKLNEFLEKIRNTPFTKADDAIRLGPKWNLYRIYKVFKDNGHIKMLDVVKVLDMGAKKHGKKSWLNAGPKSSKEDQVDSMNHHLSHLWCEDWYDKESGLHHALHLACRALMFYVQHVLGKLFRRDKTRVQ